MLRKRARAVSNGNQGLMSSDHGPLSSPTDKYSRSTSPFFSSPRLFTAFSPKAGALSDTESVMSPTSILDTKTFYSIANPFWADNNHISNKNVKPVEETFNENRHPWERSDSRGIGLGIVDSLNDDDDDDNSKKFSKPCSRMVLFGSQLKIQIPTLPFITSSPVASPKLSPNASADYGIRTPNCQSGLSPLPVALEIPSVLRSPGIFTGSLSASEMELSEDYTCVIAHGPNPRTTHIFDNFIVESCGASASPSSKGRNGCRGDRTGYPSDAFLSFCYMCKKDLGQGKDIYMYRGEKAFCSRECRDQEILFEEGRDNLTSDYSAARYGEVFDSITIIS